MAASIDWTHGPVPCRVCGAPMRPSRRKGREWAGAVQHYSEGACRPCWTSGRVAAADEPLRRRLVWRWRLLDAPVPLVHQEHEALADLMDHLRDAGLVLIGRPERRKILHSSSPEMVLDCTVRAMTETERKALQRQGVAA